MKGHYRIIAVTMALISACSSEDDIKPIYTVGEADNVITLRVGVSTGESAVQTRATDSDHTNHLALTQGTEAALRIDGTWTGHSPENVSQHTTATIGSVITSFDYKHNSVSMSPVLYWDDYGTADPANTSGRTTGLTIYGVAVDGVTIAPSEISWTVLSWTLDTNQTSGWSSKDLLTSNNIKEGNDGTLKFDEVKNNTASDLLVFTHAMSKITVNLKAGEGFADNAFVNPPTVTVLGTYLSGEVNVEEATTSVSATGSKSTITLKKEDSPSSGYTATYTGLMMPGNKYGDSDNILKINADGNIYYVTAKEINAVNTATEDVFERGKNYILNVTLKKTSIKVTATITDWVAVESANVEPVINVNANWGAAGNGSSNNFDSFSFYRSTSKLYDYSKDYSGNENSYFAPEGVAYKPNTSTDQWPFKSGETIVKLYWPNHNTHYHFRGVWPTTSVETSNTETVPHVSKVSDTDGTQKIDIMSVPYEQNSFPSDLLIGMPEFNDNNKMCQNSDHTSVDQSEYGICATEGKITLNFRYVMSQVEVVLSTSPDGSSDHVNINENTVVEIVNVANEGYVKLGDREVVPSSTKVTYTLNAVAGSGNELKRHSAIVPQVLAFTNAGASTNTRFKITVTNGDGTTDVYYADINPIKKADGTDLVAPKGKWESGVHYKYNLKLTKSEIKVSATITDWKTVNAAEDLWM